ncbi:TIGR03089 family protein [Krasilnikovia sp. MM14-A1259]|uniref:TIGR03089 family protein n=1 Tax=Krasilnikovia sp. MM14-A1259 TaxID=3373539 RepID=UPI00380FF54C
MNTTIPAGLADAVRRDPTVPLLTFYDDATGDRAELSGATLDNWVAKTANLLCDGVGTGPGDAAAVLLPPHWQTAAVLLGCWSAGLTVASGDGPQPVEVLFATPERAAEAEAWTAGERYATGLLPLAMPLRELPAGFADYVTEVRQYGDRFAAVAPVRPPDAAVGDLGHDAVCRAAAGRAVELGFGAGDRVLIDAAVHPDPVDWLLAPLLAGASVVLCAHLDAERLAARADTEKVTVTLA